MLDHCLNNQATTLRGRLKYIVKKKVFAHFVFIFCTFRFCDYKYNHNKYNNETT